MDNLTDKISVIVCVYNAESYIRRCLDSIINQTYPNLEILCVNDGSTDNSGKICDEYEKRDKRIRVFHKTNEGQDSAICTAVKYCTGQYIGMVDSDDWIEPNMYEILYNTIKSRDVSVSIVNYFIDTDTDTVPAFIKKPISDGVLTAQDLLFCTFRTEFYQNIFFPIWNKLYSSALFSKVTDFANNNYDNPLDVLYNVLAFISDGCTGAYYNKPLYHWYQRSSSMTHGALSEINLSFLKNFKIINKLLENTEYDDICVYVKRYHGWASGIYAAQALEKNDSEGLTLLQNEMRYYLDDYLEVNKDRPDRLKWFNKTLDAKID